MWRLGENSLLSEGAASAKALWHKCKGPVAQVSSVGQGSSKETTTAITKGEKGPH